MQAGKFYTEVAVKILEDFSKNLDKKEILVGFDDGQTGILILSDGKKEYTKQELLEYFDKKAELYAKDNLVNKIVDEITENEELYEEIYDKAAEETGLKGAKLNREVAKRIEDMAKEQIKKDYTIGKGKIFKLGGITKFNPDNKRMVMFSTSIKYDNAGNPTMTGIYPLSVVDDKLPVVLKPNEKKENAYDIYLNTKLVTFKQLSNLLDMYKRTLKAKEEGKIKANPFIYLKAKDNINVNLFKKMMNLSKSKTVQELNRTIPEFLEEVRKNPIDLKKIEFKMPMQSYVLDDEVKEKIKADVRKKLLNTSIAYLKKKIPEEKVKEITDNILNDYFKNDKLEFNTIYSLGNTEYGFFPETNINDRKIFLTSTVYDNIISDIQKEANDVAKKLTTKVKKNVENDIPER